MIGTGRAGDGLFQRFFFVQSFFILLVYLRLVTDPSKRGNRARILDIARFPLFRGSVTRLVGISLPSRTKYQAPPLQVFGHWDSSAETIDA